MNERLRTLLERHGGMVTWEEAHRAAAAGALRWAFRAGQVHRPLPGVYVDALADRPKGLRRAAALYAEGRGALSHTTALDVWGLRTAERCEPVHLSVPFGVRLRSRPPVVVHQRRGLRIEPPDVLIRAGLPVTRLETTLVDAWPLLSPEERPAPLIRAVTDRLTTPERILAALAAAPRLADRAAIRILLDRLGSGCHSALEIWGHDHVFTGLACQRSSARWPCARRRTHYLDVWAREERVDFELDGAASHGSPDQR